jgi:hypothetical protein
MTEPIKTIVFVVVGAVALVAAYFIDRPTQVVNVESLVGEVLNNDFEVDAPKRLKIVRYDRQTGETRQFEVASVDGVWSIPSKQDYPADATRQMAAAANALIDRKILRVAAQDAQGHEELGVVDPLSSKLDSNSIGVGTRVTMTDADGKDLVDMIIGKQVKGSDGQRYVRKANQDVVYVVELNAEPLSTSFDDWIEDDLLKLSPFDIRRVFINDYSAELGLGMTPDGRVAPHISWDRRNEFTVTYDNADSKWKLADVKKYDKPKKAMVPDQLADDEELNQDSLGTLRTALDDLLIVDVARKPDGLSADLKAGNDFLNNEEAYRDLVSKGFSPVPLKPGAEPEILSSEGEVICSLRDGVEYVLRFGQLQVQTESAAGDAASSESQSKDSAESKADVDATGEKADAAKTADDAAKKDAGSEEGKNLRRYLFVMARFNEEVIEKPKLKELPPTPESPSKPAEDEAAAPPAAGGDEPAAADKPEATDETNPEQPNADEAKEDEAKKVESKPEDKPGEAAAATGAEEKAAEGEDSKEPSAEDKAAAERKAIEEENKRLQDEYNRTVEGGKKKVAELNERFGDWYYVISNDVYKQIHLGRAQVIKKKEKPAGEGAAAPGSAASANPLSGLPNLPAASESKAAEENAATENAPASTPPATESATPAAQQKAPATEGETPADDEAPALNGESQ